MVHACVCGFVSVNAGGTFMSLKRNHDIGFCKIKNTFLIMFTVSH